MATTDESKKKEADDFATAYAEDKVKVEQTEDQAFGLTPVEVPGTDEPTGTGGTVAIDMDKEAAAAVAPAPATDPAAVTDPALEAPAAAAAPALDVEKETQRLKSWEGRLKAQQADLDRTKAGAATEEGAPAGDPAKDDAPAKTDDAAKDGDEMTGAAAMEALKEDFGAEFVTMLTALVKHVATECAAKVSGEHGEASKASIDEKIAGMTNYLERAHFEKISDAHPDFNDIAGSDEFKAWVAGMEGDEKADADRVVASGSARKIIALLNRYKAAKADKPAAAAPAAADAPAAAPAGGSDDMDAAIDQAEGVRSTGGLTLPDEPTASNDYEKAWNDA